MKSNQSLVSCYEDFLNICSSFHLPRNKIRLEEFLVLEKPGLFDQLPFGSSLIDYSSRQYLYLSQNAEEILSYDPDDYKQGIGFQYNKLLPEDRHVFGEHIFPDILRFLSTIPQSEYGKYRFSFSFRFYRKDGCISNILQHSTYLEPNICGRPLLNLVVFSDITFIKQITGCH